LLHAGLQDSSVAPDSLVPLSAFQVSASTARMPLMLSEECRVDFEGVLRTPVEVLEVAVNCELV